MTDKKTNYFSCKDDNEFYNYFFEDDTYLSKKIINKKKWQAVPVPDSLYFDTSEWISEAIHSYGNDKYNEFKFEYGGNVEFSVKINNKKNIDNCNMDDFEKDFIITNDNQDFLVYINYFSEYYVIAGDYDFLYLSLRCTKRTSKLIFEKYAESFNGPNSDSYHEYMKIWNYYQDC